MPVLPAAEWWCERAGAMLRTGVRSYGVAADAETSYLVRDDMMNEVAVPRTADEVVVVTVHVGSRPNEVAIQQEDDLAP
jgi:hypothetical protein